MFEFVGKKVADAMSAPAVSVREHTTLVEVDALLDQHGFNGCPVVDGAGRLLGLVTGLDVLRAFRITPEALVPPYHRIMGSPVVEHMRTAPITMTPETPLTRVLQRMLDLGNTGFPVVEEGRLVGVVTRRDVLRVLRECAPPGAAS